MITPHQLKRMLLILLFGFSSGLPIALTTGTLQAWAKLDGISLDTIGLFALLGLPYTIKFLWAPLVDRYTIFRFGRRKGWLIITQAGLILNILWMSSLSPQINLSLWALAAFLIAVLSATQDIVIDAFRTEFLQENERGLGSATANFGYRLGMMCSGALALVLAADMPWSNIYQIMSGFMVLGLCASIFAPEPDVASKPSTLKESVIDPIRDFFSRSGALIILLFVILYKLGDALAASLLSVFLIEVGFELAQIGYITKGIGIFATILGAFIGGAAMQKLSLYKALWIFGILQCISTLMFAILSVWGPDPIMLALTISIENICGGLGTVAFLAYLMELCNKKFTATQYALLSSLAAIPRVIISSYSGYMATMLGWFNFYIICTVAALPGLLLLFYLKKRRLLEVDRL